MSDREHLLEQFIATFAKLDDMSTAEDLDPIAWQLTAGEPDEYGWKNWQPMKVSAAPSLLGKLYARLPAPFPPLFESLVLSYRWAEVDLQSCRLLANPPGPDLNGLLHEISKDSGLWDALLPAGYIQFGRGPDLDYDPVCFDIKSRNRDGDYKIVKIDHEEILCNYRVKVVGELAPNFAELMLETIRRAARV